MSMLGIQQAVLLQFADDVSKAAGRERYAVGFLENRGTVLFDPIKNLTDSFLNGQLSIRIGTLL